MPTILIVDDEANIRRMLASLLEAEGYRALQAGESGSVYRLLETDEPDVVLLDLALPGVGGMQILARVRAHYPQVQVVMISGRASLGDAVQATKLGAFHFIEKPVAPEAVLLTVRSALEVRRARELTRALTEELGAADGLIGSSEPMQRVRELIAQVAPTDARVLVTGESGTGKELAAAALHAQSRRAAGPFVRVNSAALPRDLIESELFGHERGAFTGAAQRRRGRFELADGGTLFLDEVADLGVEAQAKLLRALESGVIERLGGHEAVRVDVRVICATNRDLRAEIGAGRFRQDLYYRMNVVPLHLPPLRERVEDIAELVAHFRARLQRRHGLMPPIFRNSALQRLRSYGWPGNVRELANICERLTILYAGQEAGAAEIDAVLPPAAAATVPLSEQLDTIERELILMALRAGAGNISEAARTLNTDRPNLYRRMKRLGIHR